MKVLSRDFTTKEKALLAVLILLLLALGYYRFLHVPCTEAIERANSEREDLQTELLISLAKESQLKKMRAELDSIGELQSASRMESYNNSKAELSLLNGVLETAESYSVSFSGVTKDGDQIRRNFKLQFRTGSFGEAKRIIRQLSESEYRCLLSSIQYVKELKRAPAEQTSGGTVVDGVRYNESVSVAVSATFYETMYGGTPDAGLPEDK
ncbi:MAG: hypothetical protein K5855_05370 [Oscillospiraceae bacterium]|jgi:hypothetical protein|nr:hypothetical protein [Oscillospiraceae bacterium]